MSFIAVLGYTFYALAFLCFIISVFTWWFPIAGQLVVVLFAVFGALGYICRRVAARIENARTRNSTISSRIPRY